MEWIRGRTIGRGATATVSLATTFSGEHFAVKSAELSVSTLLQREQEILSQLNSPRIVKYIGSSITKESNKLFYNLLTEYISGGSLHDRIRRRVGSVVDEPMIRSYMRDILLGLDYLHSNFFVHCDIKSQNILIGEDGVKIADLGCSKRVGIGSSCDLGFTGTPVFMAPEVARGEEQSFPADVWAVGCTLIEMITGSNPWPELTDPVSAIYKIGYSGDIPEYPASLSDDCHDFLNRCLVRDSKERWTTKQLLNHSFVNNLVMNLEKKANSPCSVLDHVFREEESSSSSSVLSERRRNLACDPPADRMRILSGAHDLKLNFEDWSRDEDWINVRSNSDEIGEFDHRRVESSPAMETGEDYSVVAGDGYDEDLSTDHSLDSDVGFNYFGDLDSNFENCHSNNNNNNNNNNFNSSMIHSLVYTYI
ncbi:mitogen-activated protein kinase kinase kinase 18-like, partial [Impatiens glandulifera]|uniref:mitogen-activated protein kinase kinase kinase 18-like n=1 Tax=Impatiens glandulifera TaxID=253017 RepID=UPI001FB18E22